MAAENPQQGNTGKFLGANMSQWGQGLAKAGNIGSSLATMIGGPKSEYSGKYGALAQGLDSSYDAASDALMSSGNPWGMLAGGLMKANGALNNALNKTGAGTDGMTGTDAALGSAWGMALTGGLSTLNGYFGSKSLSMTKDAEAFDQVGSSYGGTGNLVEDALSKAGKKYGYLSSGARRAADSEIMFAKMQQDAMSDIASFAKDSFAIQNSMSSINGNSRANRLQGGYNQAAIRMGRKGLKIKRMISARNMTAKSQNKPKDPYETFLVSLPTNLQNTDNYRMKDYWEFNGRPKNFGEAIAKGIFTFEDDGLWHSYSVSENPNTGEIEFMKSDTHPTHQLEIDWYNSDEGAQFRQEYELVKSSPYYKYVKRTTQEFKDGGVLGSSIIKEVNIIEEFKEGGSFNVIPEGALHARLHHMEDSDSITKKGIPVVSENEGGEIEQHAEIEREEIILRLSLTKKLEQLAKEGTDDAAIEAGKILVEEILNNTVDNTNTLL